MSESDADKVCISSFDESDPEQHTQKIMFGCGVQLGFRGKMEHQNLEVSHIKQGTFGKGHPYEGHNFVSISVMNDKTNKITLHNSYSRDTGKLMRIPVMDDDPSSSCFAGSLLRYLAKMNDGQRYLHCRHVKEEHRASQLKKGLKGFYYSNLKLGPNKIADLFKEGADRLGILTDDFCPHSLRALFITNMVNDGSVSNRESMAAARHLDVKAHLGYQEMGEVSEGNRITCILNAQPDRKRTISTPNATSTPLTVTSKNSSVSKPGFATQIEWAQFCHEKKELAKAMGMEVNSSQESINIEKAKKDLDDLDDFEVKKKKRKGSGKLRKQIEGLQFKLAEKKTNLTWHQDSLIG